jgi:hypothetical protein
MIKRLLQRFRTSLPEWYEPDDPTPREQCPCCDYVSLPERGHFLICPVCFWEDDGQDMDELDVSSGPNHGLTLRQARNNFLLIGACHEDMKKYVLPEDQRTKLAHFPRNTPET